MNMLNKTKEQWTEEATKNYKERKYAEALIACEQAIKLDATYARAFHGKGLILTRQKRYAEALEAYNKANQLEPGNAKLLFDMGDLFYRLKNYEKSFNFYKRAIQLDRKYEQLYNKRLRYLIDKTCNLREKELRNKISIALEQVLIIDPHDTSTRRALTEIKNYPFGSYSLGPYSFWADSNRSTNRSFHSYELGTNTIKVHPFNCRCKDCIEY